MKFAARRQPCSISILARHGIFHLLKVLAQVFDLVHPESTFRLAFVVLLNVRYGADCFLDLCLLLLGHQVKWKEVLVLNNCVQVIDKNKLVDF